MLVSVFWLVLGMFTMVAFEGTTYCCSIFPTNTRLYTLSLHLLLDADCLTCGAVLFDCDFWLVSRTEWDYIDAFYFCLITLTTVGLGDFVPETGPGIKFAYFYCMVSGTDLPGTRNGMA